MSIRQSMGLRAPLLALVGVSLGSFGAPSVLAGDTPSATPEVVASVPMSRLGARLPRASLSGVDLNLLWAQYRPANTIPAEPEAAEEDDTILVAFSLGSPDSANQEIAKEYGLELVDSRELTALGLRLVRYRVNDDRPVAGVVANLLRDARVERAQVSVTYRAPAPPADVASKTPTPPAVAKTRPVRPAERIKGAVSVAQAPKSSPAPRQPAEARLDVGDILSGGL